MEHACGGGCVMSAAGQWCCVCVLLVYDGCMEVDDKSSMRVLVGVWDVHWMVERDCWYVSVVWDSWLDDDEDGRALLCEKELNGWSAGQQRARVPTIHCEGGWDGSSGACATSPACCLVQCVGWLLLLLVLLLL